MGKAEGQRGAFIVLEGLDRSGKSTQVKRLAESLKEQGHDTKMMNFPNRQTAVGSVINSYLQSGQDLDDAAIHLLFSANRWEAVKQIRADLAAGITVVCDRYAFSGVAFTAAKDTLDYEWCRAPDKGLPAPDVVFYLDVSPDVAQQRGGYGEERYEKREFQDKVRKVFSRMQKEDSSFWRVIDANQSLDKVAEAVTEVSLTTVEQVAVVAGLHPVNMSCDKLASGR